MLCYRARVERTDVLLCSVAGLPNIHCIPILVYVLFAFVDERRARRPRVQVGRRRARNLFERLVR